MSAAELESGESAMLTRRLGVVVGAACLLLGLLGGQGCATKVVLDPVSCLPWAIPDLGMELMPVVAGSFMMGSNRAFSHAKPVHEVQITQSYWIGKTEVTQVQWQAIMENNPSHCRGDGSQPVENVPWDEAVSFCNKLTKRERDVGRLPGGYVYRLPTEAEWEYAAGGGNKSKGYVFSGSDNLDDVAWYKYNCRGRTKAVGQKKPNELGLYDMSGNAWEWCHDWHGDYPSGSVTDPIGPSSGSYRVIRGGCWDYCVYEYRVTRRDMGYDFFYCGLRVVLAPPIPADQPSK